MIEKNREFFDLSKNFDPRDQLSTMHAFALDFLAL